MRARLCMVLVAVVLLPMAGARVVQDASEAPTLQPDSYRVIALDAIAGDAFAINVTSDAPIDALLVAGNVDDFYAPGGSYRLLLIGLNATTLSRTGAFPDDGPWSLVLDNTNRSLVDGGNGTRLATARVHVVLERATVAVEPAAGDGGARNPWPVLMLTAPHWDLAIFGLGGMALWFLLLGAFAAWRYREGWAKVGVVAVGVGLLLGVWGLLPHPGPISQVGFPLLVAVGVAWLGSKGALDVRQQVRLAFLGAGLGALLGGLLAFAGALAWSDAALLVLGDDRFIDPVFVLPVAAVLGVLLFSLVTAFVHAFDEEETAPAALAPGMGSTFAVRCLRCGTSITVDRSMRRHRVATDLYEFACPNCQTWMEWAEPKPDVAKA